MESISGRKSIKEFASDHAFYSIQESQWKQQLLDGATLDALAIDQAMAERIVAEANHAFHLNM